VITDFENVLIDSLVPYESSFFNSYAMQNIFIKGYVNDSIKINFGRISGDPKYSYFLKDSIDTRLYRDYYGGYTGYFYFDPYKATEGKLEIRHSLD
jgi:hypothetical protein